jgi:His-Xaa-Ser system protein HxsD
VLNRNNEEKMNILLKSRIYPLEAVLSASNNFLNVAYISLDFKKKDEIFCVSFKMKKKMNTKKQDALRGEFMNELLHCCLRHQVSKNNKKMREFIVGRALYSPLSDSNFDLLSEDGKLEYQEDPLGIAIPWEEKYGKRSKK